MRVAAQQPARPVTIRSTARTKDMASTRVVENGFPNQKQKKLQKQVLFIQVGEVQGFILVWAHNKGLRGGKLNWSVSFLWPWTLIHCFQTMALRDG